MWSSVLQWFKTNKKKAAAYVAICVNLWILAVFLLAWITCRLISEAPWQSSPGARRGCPPLSPLLGWGAGGSSFLACTLPASLPARPPLPTCGKDALGTFSLRQRTKIKFGNEVESRLCILQVLLYKERGWCGRIGEDSGYSVSARCMAR